MGNKKILVSLLVISFLAGSLTTGVVVFADEKPTKLIKECAKDPKKPNKIKPHCELLNMILDIQGGQTLEGLSCNPNELAQWNGDSWVCVTVESLQPVFPTSCLELLNQAPETFDGFYSIDPDGLLPQPPSQVYCDMTTDGGGWTLVYTAPNNNQNILTPVYDFASTILFDSSTQALVGYRTSANSLLPESAILDIPANWKTAHPLSYLNEVEAASIFVDGIGPTATQLKYGTFSFSQTCNDPFTVASYGKLCFEGTNGPFYNGFTSGASEFCVNSLGNFNSGPACSSDRVFTIAFR